MTMKIKNYPYTITGLNVEIKLASDFKQDKKGTSIATGKVNIQPYFYKEVEKCKNGDSCKIKIVDKHCYIFTSLKVKEDLQSIVAKNFTAAVLNTCKFPDFKSKIGLNLDFVITGKTLNIAKETQESEEFTPELLKDIIKKLHDHQFPEKVDGKEVAGTLNAAEGVQNTDKKNKIK